MRSKTIPSGKVTVVTAGNEPVTYECQAVDVPIDQQGRPLLTRVEQDNFNNLRVIISSTSYVQFHADTWRDVKVEEYSTVMQAVKHAS